MAILDVQLKRLDWSNPVFPLARAEQLLYYDPERDGIRYNSGKIFPIGATLLDAQQDVTAHIAMRHSKKKDHCGDSGCRCGDPPPKVTVTLP